MMRVEHIKGYIYSSLLGLSYSPQLRKKGPKAHNFIDHKAQDVWAYN